MATYTLSGLIFQGLGTNGKIRGWKMITDVPDRRTRICWLVRIHGPVIGKRGVRHSKL